MNKKIEKANASKAAYIGILLLAIFVGIAFVPGEIYAHAPQDIQISYDGATQSLKVTITHTSKSPDKHYIKKVQILKNGAAVQTIDYNSQPSQDTFSYDYKAPVGVSDVMEVKATCSVFGSKTKKLSGPGPSKELR